MRVELEMWEAVWERSLATVEIPDEELAEYGDNEQEAVTDWVYDNLNEWLPNAHHSIEGSVDSMDYSLDIKPEGKDGWVSS